MYALGDMGDLTAAQDRQLAALRADIARINILLANPKLSEARKDIARGRLADDNAKIASMLSVTMPVPPLPLPPVVTVPPIPGATGATGATGAAGTPGALAPLVFSSVPVSSPPVTTTTEVPATAGLGIDSNWLYIAGGLLLLSIISGRRSS